MTPSTVLVLTVFNDENKTEQCDSLENTNVLDAALWAVFLKFQLSVKVLTISTTARSGNSNSSLRDGNLFEKMFDTCKNRRRKLKIKQWFLDVVLLVIEFFLGIINPVIINEGSLLKHFS